jgi:hypothetical protein
MDQHSLFVKMTLQNWDTYIGRADQLFAALSDEQLLKEVSPGRNSGIYLLGHLTSVHDKLLPMLEGEEAIYPQLEKPFLTSPDKSGLEFPSVAELRGYWTNVNRRLKEHMNALSTEEWFNRHTAVSAEDFAKEPHRNKLNVVLNRTGHLSYHLGQLAFLKGS